jgi:hypothetical protein
MILSFFFLSKHQNEAEFKNLYGSEVLHSDFPGLTTSAASTASMASMTFTASFHQKNNDPDGWISPGKQITNTGLSFVEWIIKNPTFR